MFTHTTLSTCEGNGRKVELICTATPKLRADGTPTTAMLKAYMVEVSYDYDPALNFTMPRPTLRQAQRSYDAWAPLTREGY